MPRRTHGEHPVHRLDEGPVGDPDPDLADILEIPAGFGEKSREIAERLFGLRGGVAESVKLAVEVVTGLGRVSRASARPAPPWRTVIPVSAGPGTSGRCRRP